jgi:hypothetical protein
MHRGPVCISRHPAPLVKEESQFPLRAGMPAIGRRLQQTHRLGKIGSAPLPWL